MKTVELKFQQSKESSKKNFPNIILLKSTNSKFHDTCDDSNSNMKSISLQYVGMINDKLGIASKKFKTKFNLIDISLSKSLQNSYSNFKSENNQIYLKNYINLAKSENSLNLPILSQSEQNEKMNLKSSEIESKKSDLNREIKMKKNYSNYENDSSENESELSIKNLKVIEAFKSFKENQVPVTFRNFFKNKPYKSQAETLNGNRYDIKNESYEKYFDEINQKKKEMRRGFCGKRIEEHKNLYLPKFKLRLKSNSSTNKKLFIKGEHNQITGKYLSSNKIENNLNTF